MEPLGASIAVKLAQTLLGKVAEKVPWEDILRKVSPRFRRRYVNQGELVTTAFSGACETMMRHETLSRVESGHSSVGGYEIRNDTSLWHLIYIESNSYIPPKSRFASLIAELLVINDLDLVRIRLSERINTKLGKSSIGLNIFDFFFDEFLVEWNHILTQESHSKHFRAYMKDLMQEALTLQYEIASDILSKLDSLQSRLDGIRSTTAETLVLAKAIDRRARKDSKEIAFIAKTLVRLEQQESQVLGVSAQLPQFVQLSSEYSSRIQARCQALRSSQPPLLRTLADYGGGDSFSAFLNSERARAFGVQANLGLADALNATEASRMLLASHASAYHLIDAQLALYAANLPVATTSINRLFESLPHPGSWPEQSSCRLLLTECGQLFPQLLEMLRLAGHYEQMVEFSGKYIWLRSAGGSGSMSAILRAKSWLVQSLRLKGRLEESLMLSTEAYCASERLPRRDSSRCYVWHAHAENLRISDSTLPQALRLHRRSVRLHKQLLGRFDPDTLGAEYGLAETLRRLGRTHEALALHTRVLEDKWQVLPPQDREYLGSLHATALCLRALHRYTDAIDVHEKCVAQFVEQFSPVHPDTLMTRIAFATTKCAARLREGEAELQELLPICMVVFGAEDKRTTTIVDVLSKVSSVS